MIRRVALLGAGVGEKHLDGYAQLRDRFAVTHVCDLNMDAAERLATRAGAQTSARVDAMIADPNVDVVDICLPPRLHAPVALQALARGKHVILEKPIAGSLREAERLAAAAAVAHGRLFPVFQYRFGRGFEALARLRRAGFLSRPLSASLETHWNRDRGYYATPWRGSWAHEFGGAVLSHAIHAHDLLAFTFGPVAAVSAMLATRVNPIETEDCAAITFAMASGATAASSITLGAANDTSRLRWVYDDVTVESGRLPYAPGEADWSFQARDPNRQAEIDDVVAATANDGPEGFAGLLAAIADALDGAAGREVTVDDAVASIELAAAIYQSDRTGRRVALPVDRNLPICDGFAP